MLSNVQTYKELVMIVVDKYIGNKNIKKKIECTELEVNDFSICFGIDVIDHFIPRGVYVKIPKVDLYKQENKTIMPITLDDRNFAEEEYRSLTHLSQIWRCDDINISFVRPLGFLEEYNAIITERAYGEYLFKAFRRWDLIARMIRGHREDLVNGIMLRIGKALYRFHESSKKESMLRVGRILSKIRSYMPKIASFGVSSQFLKTIEARLASAEDCAIRSQVAKTLKGLDIRNIIIDKAGRLLMLDPGKMKEDVREADLARFLITCRILYWGSMAFFLRLCPNASYEESFLKGYYGGNGRPSKVFNILLVKELVKHWHLAHVALHLKLWPTALKSFLRHSYIDSFYKRQIIAELTKLE